MASTSESQDPPRFAPVILEAENAEDAGGSENVVESVDVQFVPVIILEHEVEVRTLEEEEDVLFKMCWRCMMDFYFVCF